MPYTITDTNFRKNLFLIIAAAFLSSLSFIYVQVIFSLPALVFLSYALIGSTAHKHVFYFGLLFGALSSFFINYWMIPVIAHYAGGNVFLGSVCYLASALVLAVFFGLQFYSFSLLRFQNNRKFSLLLNALLFSSTWVLFEWIRAEFFSAMPWLSYHLALTEARSLFLIQPAAYGGVWMLSFLLLFSAFFTAASFYSKKWKYLFIPAFVVGLQYVAGYFIYTGIREKLQETKPFSAALILPGLSPETVWNDQSANVLVAHLFSLQQNALKKNTDLLVWTETVVPWTYTPDDDFVKELTKNTSTTHTSSLLGINTANGSAGKLCNSVYLLAPDGKNTHRYDKQDLLTLVEKPLFSQNGNIILPFLTQYDLKMSPGKNQLPLETAAGKAGVLLCNESTSPALAARHVQNGATFLVNMGNDSWFSDYFISLPHFYSGRLRAVENRKDIIVNNNCGISGVVRASGEIVVQQDGRKNGVVQAEIFPNTLASSNTFLALYISMAIVVLAIVFKFVPNSLINQFIN
jgi:apolipoprotein N-acyltransferase